MYKRFKLPIHGSFSQFILVITGKPLMRFFATEMS